MAEVEPDDAGNAQTTVAIMTGRAPICRTARERFLNHHLGYDQSAADSSLNWRDAWRDAAVLTSDWHSAAAIDEAEFDFDNDQRIDRVTLFSHCCFYMRGAAALVDLGRSRTAPPPRAEDGLAVDFSEHRYWYLPCQWDASGPAIRQCPGFSQDRDEAMLSMETGDGLAPISFRARYTRLIPVRIEQTTYVFLRTDPEPDLGYVAVIKPLPRKRFAPLCLLRVTTEAP